MTPSWPKFSRLTATPELFDAIDALGVEVPPEGRPRSFVAYRDDDATLRVNFEHYKDLGAHGFVVYADGSSRYLSSAKAIRQALKIPYGSPTAKALTRFLAWWGMGADAVPVVEPQEQTKTII